MNTNLNGKLVWIDCEMSGLEVDTCRLLEIAVVITDNQLNPVGNKLELVIHQPQHVLDSMDEWCTLHHSQSGLTKKVQSSTISEAAAEETVVNHIKSYCVLDPKPLIAGNSVHADLAFIKKYMPNLAAILSYRVLDVSTIKELSFRWTPHISRKAPLKNLNHRALDDILESIEELKFYKENLFKL
ncbi:hypothetical protein BB559_003881 [Furculomyces boomerangus]|uniref:Exonuclease domain-containing protein n=2 Tax=Harpellales TaxID=61421 RepID=A0A2T9YI85_9FUNG|nr:hypothetical protein BB559_003881 [Furculomyces boomerangus]PWA00190.1 hypothetical protein BB558_003772 [Smittium angustum]PWA01533.1 hypothetical protein BB558_002373 [Smittium angustum]